jgi:hypothetical protein
MTTDPPPGGDGLRDARLDALRRRRAEGGSSGGRASPVPTDAGPARRVGRRRHAALSARILGGGLSVAATIGLMGAMADGESATSTPATGVDASMPTVVLVTIGGERLAVAPVTAAPVVHAAAAVPNTTSRGS